MTRPAVRRLMAVLVCAICAGCGMQRPVDRAEWVTMGTVAAVQVRAPAKAKDMIPIVRAAFDRVNAEFNAFDPASVLSRTGGCTSFGQPCWDFAFELRQKTDGRFDPAWKGDGRLDFGAVAKGFAVDVAADAVRSSASVPKVDVLLDLGGNLKAVRGTWHVGIKDGATFELKEGEACATSARYFRGDHIKDARKHCAVTNDLHSVTVIHPSSAMVADGLSTALFILGREQGEAFIRQHFREARVIWLPE